MIVNYSDQPVQKGRPSIFLAGPTIRPFLKRKGEKSWREEAIKFLGELKFNGIVYVPEFEHFDTERQFQHESDKEHESHDRQIRWEWAALDSSDTIVFWIPRRFPDLPALVTNVEFGFYMRTGKIIYGRPDGSDRNGYLDKLYFKVMGKTPFNDLGETLKAAVQASTKATKVDQTSLDKFQGSMDINKLHTTPMGAERIRQNLGLNVENIVAWCKEKISQAESITRQGKNWYADIGSGVITINIHSHTIITAHKRK